MISMLKQGAFPTINLPMPPQQTLKIEENDLPQPLKEKEIDHLSLKTLPSIEINSLPQIQQLIGENSTDKQKKKCSVSTCHGGNSSKNIRYYRFPLENKKLCKIWAFKCGKPDMIYTAYHYICSRHFKPKDFKKCKHKILPKFFFFFL